MRSSIEPRSAKKNERSEFELNLALRGKEIILKTIKFGLVASTWMLATSPQVFAWGGRGHNTICDAAVFLTQEKGLREYLQAKPHIMGYLCNIPDTHWRSISGEVSKLGGPTHYLDMELLGVKPEDFPTDLKAIIKNYEGKENPLENGQTIKSIPTEMGTNWWRADQFYRRAIALGEAWKKAKPPQNSKEEQSDDLEFNKLAGEFVLNLGVMGHFVGDNGQPYHSTIDYDGYESGHGGIHAYFEETMVSAQGPEIYMEIIKEARKLQKNKSKNSFLKNDSVLENMKQLGIQSFKDISEVKKIDQVLTPSTYKEEKGMTLKTPAVRKENDQMAPKFRPLIVKCMARSAALLAQIWDEAYVKVGRPILASHKSYNFPHKPDFIAPDYLDTTEKK